MFGERKEMQGGSEEEGIVVMVVEVLGIVVMVVDVVDADVCDEETTIDVDNPILPSSHPSSFMAVVDLVDFGFEVGLRPNDEKKSSSSSSPIPTKPFPALFALSCVVVSVDVALLDKPRESSNCPPSNPSTIPPFFINHSTVSPIIDGDNECVKDERIERRGNVSGTRK